MKWLLVPLVILLLFIFCSYPSAIIITRVPELPEVTYKFICQDKRLLFLTIDRSGKSVISDVYVEKDGKFVIPEALCTNLSGLATDGIKLEHAVKRFIENAQ